MFTLEFRHFALHVSIIKLFAFGFLLAPSFGQFGGRRIQRRSISQEKSVVELRYILKAAQDTECVRDLGRVDCNVKFSQSLGDIGSFMPEDPLFLPIFTCARM